MRSLGDGAQGDDSAFSRVISWKIHGFCWNCLLLQAETPERFPGKELWNFYPSFDSRIPRFHGTRAPSRFPRPSFIPISFSLSFPLLPDPSRAFLGRFQTRAPSPRHWDDSQLTQALPRALFLGLHPTFPVQKHPGRRKSTAPAPRRRRWKFVIPRDFSRE